MKTLLLFATLMFISPKPQPTNLVPVGQFVIFYDPDLNVYYSEYRGTVSHCLSRYVVEQGFSDCDTLIQKTKY